MVLDDSVMRRSDALKEMMELARQILADGQVTEVEAKVFQTWIERNPEVKGIAKVERMIGILRNVFSDGYLSPEERDQLAEALDDFRGS